MKIGLSVEIKFWTRKMITRTHFMSPCKMINLFRDVVINVFPKKHDLWVEMPTYPLPPSSGSPLPSASPPLPRSPFNAFLQLINPNYACKNRVKQIKIAAMAFLLPYC